MNTVAWGANMFLAEKQMNRTTSNKHIGVKKGEYGASVFYMILQMDFYDSSLLPEDSQFIPHFMSILLYTFIGIHY